MQELGYATHAIHNNNATFYDRNIVYSNLSFETFTTLEYMNDVDYNPLGWAKDSVLTNEILKALQATDGRDFVFGVSVQAHGKYPTEPIEGAPTIRVSGMDDNEGRKNGMEYYLYQLKESDKFLGELTRTLANFDEPTILVVYGDHLPSFNIQQEELSYGDVQSTEYAIWANYPVHAEDATCKPISSARTFSTSATSTRASSCATIRATASLRRTRYTRASLRRSSMICSAATVIRSPDVRLSRRSFSSAWRRSS